jgi:hypothetical protein
MTWLWWGLVGALLLATAVAAVLVWRSIHRPEQFGPDWDGGQ